MKAGRFIYFIFSLFFFFSCAEKKNDLTDMNLRGDVKSVQEFEYDVVVDEFGKVKKGKLLQSTKKVFNKKGRLEELDVFDMDGDTVQKIVSIYDDNGMLSKRLIYDDLGKLSFISVFAHDEKGRQTEAMQVDEEGQFLQKEVTEYNDDNMIETSILYNKNNEQIKKEVRQMDKKGLPKDVKIYNEKRELVNFRKETYNENEQLVSFDVYASDEQTVVLSAALTYDKGGNLIKQEAIDETGDSFLPENYKYEFDPKLNWIVAVRYVGVDAKTLSERVIDYY